MLLTLGIDIYTVSKLLGHTDIKTTQIYAKIVDKKKQDAVDKIPQIL
jgi:site-specific recombinase XerD